jgi:hypothetical protein
MMPARWTVLLYSLCVVSGCSLLADTHHVAYLAKRTTELEPSFFSYFHNEHATRLRNRAAANEAWRQVAADSPVGYSSHYAKGFVCGFADYLHRGGTGEPPLVPPRSYWGLNYQNVAGKQAIEDWYQGFRHGSDECRMQGLRDLAVVPSSLATSATASPYDHVMEAETAPEEIDFTEQLPPLE